MILDLKTPGEKQDLREEIKSLRSFIMQLVETVEIMFRNLGHDNIDLGDMLNKDGIDPKYLVASNLGADTSFEVMTTYWSGGTKSSDAKHTGSYSMKLIPGASSKQQTWTINPTWYGSKQSRVTFHKKFGRVRVRVLDTTTNEPLKLYTDAGSTGKSIDFAYNKNWDESSRCTFHFDPGSSTSITVEFSNVDDKYDVYIDDFHIHNDLTKKPVLYQDGSHSNSYEDINTTMWVGTYAEAVAKTDWDNKEAALVTDDYSEHKVTTKIVTSTLTREDAGIIYVNSSASTIMNLPTDLQDLEVDKIEYYFINVGSGTTTIGAAAVNGIGSIALGQYKTLHVLWDGTAYKSVGNTYTASKALVSDSKGLPVTSAVTSTELGYVAGVTSAIQTQINALNIPTFSQSDVPSTTQIIDDKLGVWVDSDDSKCYLCYNHDGTIKKVELV